MQTIFIMVKCELGCAYKVADDIMARIEQTSELYSISGQFDLMAKFYIEADADIGHFVNETVQRIDGIVDTLTIVTFKAF